MPQKQIEASENHIIFWNNWLKPEKITYWILLILFLFSIGGYLFSYWFGMDFVIHWEKVSELDVIKVVIDYFTEGLYDFPVEANNYIITEKFMATPMLINEWAGWLWLVCFTISILFLLAIVTTLPRFWYLGGMTAFLLVLFYFKFEFIQLFGSANKLGLVLALIIYFPASYYFHEYRKQTPFFLRLGVFAILTLLFAFLILFFGKGGHPVLYLTSYGIISGILLTFLFIIMVSHEIVIGVAQFTTFSGKKSGLIYFCLIILFYTGNLLLLHLKNSMQIHWDISVWNVFIVFAISAIFGIWGFRKQNQSSSSIFPFLPQGAFLYICLGIISFSTITYFFVTGNDPMIEMFEDAITFAHIGVGIMFFVYVLVNFAPLMRKGHKIYKIIYKPMYMSVFICRGLGLLIGVILFMQVNRYPYYQGIAGYYNGLGDLYRSEKAYILAEEYYKTASRSTGYLENHKSNYSLYSLAHEMNNTEGEAYYLQRSMLKKPTVYTYVALGNWYGNENFFQAIFALQDGLKLFPHSSEIYNNIALLYCSKSITDSAYYYFDKAEEYAENPDLVKANRLAYQIKNKLILNPDSVVKNINSEYITLKANKLALVNYFGKEKITDHQNIPKDTLLSREEFAFWFNYGIHNHSLKDTLFQKKLAALESKNELFAEDLKYTRTLNEYYTGSKLLAMNMLNALEQGSGMQDEYFARVLGLWFSQQGAYKRAIENFDNAIQSHDTLSYTNRAFAFAELGLFSDALAVLLQHNDGKIVSQNLQKVLQAMLDKNSLKAFEELNDAEKALYVYFNKGHNFESEIMKMSNADFKAFALAETARKYLSENNIEKAAQILESVGNAKLQGLPLQKINYETSYLWLAQKKYSKIIAEIDQKVFPKDKENEKLFLKAVSYENTGNIAESEKFYRNAVTQLPLNEKVVLQASVFFTTQKKNDVTAYEMLLNGIQINPYSVDLYKAYILKSVEMSLFKYAETALNDLKNITSLADYQAFDLIYQSKKALMEKEQMGFQ